MIRHTLAAAAWIATSMGTIRAEQIRWDALYAQLNAKCPFCGDGGFTRDGSIYHAEDFCIAPDRARLDCCWQDAPASEDVVRIEVRGAKRFLNFTVASALLPVGGGGSHCSPLRFIGTLAMLSPMWAVSVVSAPVTLSMDAVSHLLSTRIFEIVP
jgi:hypothetical protein